MTDTDIVAPFYEGGIRQALNDRTGSAFERAARYAWALHVLQKRKGTDIPYFTHLIGTAEIAKAHGANETEQMAALLHDAIEDQPRDGKTAEEIREHFGEEVFSIVMACKLRPLCCS